VNCVSALVLSNEACCYVLCAKIAKDTPVINENLIILVGFRAYMTCKLGTVCRVFVYPALSPCGGGLYHHCSPGSRKSRRKGDVTGLPYH
jgi:hypothetical protein